MNEKLTKYGWIGAAIGGIGLGVGAIVAECRRHKTKKELNETEAKLYTVMIDNGLKSMQIRQLENQLNKPKSKSEEKES